MRCAMGFLISWLSILVSSGAWAFPQVTNDLEPCGVANYHPSNYTCYGDFLCPIIDDEPTLKCGNDCYLPEMYSCQEDHLIYPPNQSSCSKTPTALHLSDPPYENYFYSDCNVDAQVVITSPLPNSNLTIIGPRLVVAWPAGNSGVCAFFQPQNGINGSLVIELVNSSIGSPLGAVYRKQSTSEYPNVGLKGVLRFNSSAELTVSILGSVRTIRDFTEGPSLLQPVIQDAIVAGAFQTTGAYLSRVWLDNVTITNLSFVPQGNNTIQIENKTLKFDEGDYLFSADLNYPQLKQLTPEEVLNSASQGLISQMSDQATSLSFLSYTEKLLAGAWRFLTYFGRDSMISALLLNPVLSEGNASAIEAVIGAVLERINRTDGSVCHEETIGDYATYLNLQENITSTDPGFDYKMIDSDYYLPILMQQYFVQNPLGQSRLSTLLSEPAGSVNPKNVNLTYGDLALINAEKIMDLAAPFAAQGNQTVSNLIHLKEGQIVGEWRDSTYGIGGGRIPYDVNTALVPAALRAIASLSLTFNESIYPDHPDWSTLAATYAQIWEDSTLSLFAVTVSQSEAQSRLDTFTNTSNFYNGPSHSSTIDADVTFHGLALDGYNNLSNVDVMNTDDCFRLFLLNTTDQAQLTSFLNQSALNIIRPFPAGLRTPVGIVVANPALSTEDVLRTNFTNAAYHGTVVWSWQLAMTAKGLEYQLDRCSSSSPSIPEFCNDTIVYSNVQYAYNLLWDTIEANAAYLSSEVWSWVDEGGEYQVTPLGSLPPPPGVGGATESDVRQLWSLTFLAVKRVEGLGV